MSSTPRKLPCPACGRYIPATALKCRYCRAALDRASLPDGEVERALRYRRVRYLLGFLWILFNIASLLGASARLAIIALLLNPGAGSDGILTVLAFVVASQGRVFIAIGLINIMVGLFIRRMHVWAIWVQIAYSYCWLGSSILSIVRSPRFKPAMITPCLFALGFIALGHYCLHVALAFRRGRTLPANR